MPQQWTKNQERQYEHIKEGYEERGKPEKKAKELAARTVSKERSRSRSGQHLTQESRWSASTSLPS